MDVRRGEVGQRNAVRINNSDVIVISSNDIILRSERGRGAQKRPINFVHP